MIISRRNTLRTAAAGAALFAIGSSRSRGQSSDPARTMRFVPASEPTRFDPHFLASYPTRDVSFMTYDTLFSSDSKGNPQPQMVGDFHVSDDKLTYDFKLRPGQAWHDGTKVRAADCVASLRRWMKRDGMGQLIQGAMASLDAKDDESFTLVLKDRLGIVLQALAKPGNVVPFMMREKDAMVDDLGVDYRPVGSGPYIFNADLYRAGNKLVFDRNPNYVPRAEPADYQSGGKKANFDRVEWVIMPNASSAVNALQAGEIDYIQWINFDDVDSLRQNPAVKVIRVDPFGKQGYLRPNHLIPPFNNPVMRQVLLYLNDQEVYLRAITANHKDLYNVCGAYFMCGEPFASDAGWVKPDAAKAKELMKQAGYDGSPVKLFETTNVQANMVAALVAHQLLQKAGFKIDATQLDLGTILQRRQVKDTWNLMWGYIESGDCSSPLGNPYFRANCELAMPGWPCDAKLEELRTAFAHEPDLAKQKDLARQMNERAYQVVPYVATGEYVIPSAIRASVTNVLTSGGPVFWGLSKTA